MPFLAGALAKNPEGLALEDEKGALTYGELGEGAERVARWPPRAWVWAQGKWWRSRAHSPGKTSRPSTGSGKPAALRSLSTTDGPSRSEIGRSDSSLPALPWRGESPLSSPPGVGSSSSRPWNPTGDPEAARLLTSGTTGTPGVVGISVSNLRASAEASRERLGLDQGDRWLCSLSPAHVGGLALITRAALLGSGLVFRGPFTVQGIVELLEEGSITHASLVPTMLHQLLDEWGDRPAPAGLRCILVGGAPAREELVQCALRCGVPHRPHLWAHGSQLPGGDGPAIPGKGKARVCGPSPFRGELRFDESGQLLVRGPTVAPGMAREDGWLETGDLAREDADGHLWITGR